MRLLPKSELDRAKALDKKREIDEGLKLAKKIDTLREIAAAEETSLATFRVKTLEAIHEETTQAATMRDAVKSELRVAQDELAEARKPLDEEWLMVADVKAELDRRGETVDAREDLVIRRERTVELEEKKVIGIIARATTREELALARSQDAEQAATKAESLLTVAQKVKEDALELERKTHKELTHRDMLASARERDVTIREQHAGTREQELETEWRLLKDREAMFERNLKRK